LPVHYPYDGGGTTTSLTSSDPSADNATTPAPSSGDDDVPHSDVGRMYRFYTTWNFHLVWFYFCSAAVFSFRGWRGGARSAANDGTSNRHRASSAHSSSRSSGGGGGGGGGGGDGGGAYAQWLGVEEDRYSRDFELEGDENSGPHPNACHRLHHVVMEIELATTPMICLVVWAVLFEGVEHTQGKGEALHKFVNFDSLTQHAANVGMIWVDFYLNGLFVVPMHFLYVYLWMGVYTLVHSVIWLETCFLAYPFMDLTKNTVFLWFFGIGALHGFFFAVGVCASRCKRARMIRALAAKASRRGGGGGGQLLRHGGSEPWQGGRGGSWPVAFIAGATAADDSGLVGAYLVDGDESSAASSINSRDGGGGGGGGERGGAAAGSHRRVNSSHYLMGSL
jgi:hypothetical protein